MVDPGLVTCPCNKENSVCLPGVWQVTVWLQSDGRRVVELCDRHGSLAGLIVSTRLPIVSIDWGWRGIFRDANGARRWWALAAGHFPAADSQPVVTFTRGLRRPRRTAEPGMIGGLWMAASGLWVAAVTGRYSAVGCSLASSATARRLTPITARRAP